MFTSITKQRVLSLWWHINESLSSIRKLTNEIKEKKIFNVSLIYDKLNKFHREKITFYDISCYMKSNCLLASLTEIKLMLYCIGKEELNLEDFCTKMIGLNSKKMNDKALSMLLEDQMKFEELLQERIKLAQNIIFYSDLVRKREDFSIKDMMVIIGKNEKEITKDDFKFFFDCNNLYLSDESVNDLFDVFAISNRNTMTYSDIDNIINFNPTKKYFIAKMSNNQNYSFHEISSPIKTLRNIPISKIEYNSNDEYLLLNYLAFIMEKESQIEDTKNQLVFQSDFCIPELFRFFDTDSKEYITTNDIISVYNLFSIDTNVDDIYLIMKRYSSRNNTLSYSDFVDMLSPYVNIHYRDIVMNRRQYRCSYYILYKNFKDSMKFLMKNLLSLIYEAQIDTDKEKRKLPINIVEIIKKFIFPKISHIEHNKMSKNELHCYLRYSNIIFRDDEYELLYHRLDRENKGYIDVNDIVKEFV